MKTAASHGHSTLSLSIEQTVHEALNYTMCPFKATSALAFRKRAPRGKGDTFGRQCRRPARKTTADGPTCSLKARSASISNEKKRSAPTGAAETIRGRSAPPRAGAGNSKKKCATESSRNNKNEKQDRQRHQLENILLCMLPSSFLRRAICVFSRTTSTRAWRSRYLKASLILFLAFLFGFVRVGA